MAHAGICQHGWAGHLATCASTLGRSTHTNIIIIHIVQTSAPFIPKSKIIDSIKMATLSRRLGGPGLTPRTSARMLGEARMALRVSTSHLCYICFLCRIHFFCDLSKTTATSVSSNAGNAKHFRHICKKKKKNRFDLPFGSPAP